MFHSLLTDIYLIYVVSISNKKYQYCVLLSISNLNNKTNNKTNLILIKLVLTLSNKLFFKICVTLHINFDNIFILSINLMSIHNNVCIDIKIIIVKM